MPPAGSTATTTTTADWRDSYLTSLQEAERNSPVNRDLVTACSALADRVAALEAEKAVLALQVAQPPQQQSQRQQQQQDAQPRSPNPASPSPSRSSTSTPTPSSATDTTATATAAIATDPAVVAQTRLDLAEALRSKGQLQARLRAAEEELRKLRAKSRADEKRIRDLAAERAALGAKLKDRGEELVEKSKMVTVRSTPSSFGFFSFLASPFWDGSSKGTHHMCWSRIWSPSSPCPSPIDGYIGG